jgi:hypothetical protein
VHDQVEAVQAELVDGGHAELPESRPAVVVAGRALGQAEAGQVERHAAQAAVGQLGQHLPVQERGADHPVDAQHHGPGALFGHEAAHPGGWAI